VTTRGMGVPEMKTIADIVTDVLVSRGDESAIGLARKKVEKLVRRFPLYPSLLKEFKK